MNIYQFGQVAGVNVIFTLVAGGAPTDPTTVWLRVLDGAGIETTGEYTGGVSVGTIPITKNSVGNYSAQITLSTVAGFWNYRWEGSGAVVAASEGRLQVTQSNFSDAQP